MKNRRFVVPEPKGYDQAYELAYKLAAERLTKIEDIEQQCDKAGAQYQVRDGKKVITLTYLNQTYAVTLPDINVSLAESDEGVPIRDRILILHYLGRAKGTPGSDKLITYKELPEGNVYSPTFLKRTVNQLLKYFDKEPYLLVDVARRLGGHQVTQGDVGVTINAFSRVPITLVLWRGDDEFGPDGSILFDANISDYLSTEDITVLCETITWKLINHLKTFPGQKPGAG